jgi:chitinase
VATPGVSITFTATANDGATYSWDFDDGTASGRVVSHTFDSAGSYTVILTVQRSGDTKGDSVGIDVPC